MSKIASILTMKKFFIIVLLATLSLPALSQTIQNKSDGTVGQIKSDATMQDQYRSDGTGLNDNEQIVYNCLQKLAKQPDPKEFILGIFSWKTDKPNPQCTGASSYSESFANTIDWTYHLNALLFTKRLAEVYLISTKCMNATGEICCPDADPISLAQDVPNNWSFIHSKISRDSAQVAISGDFTPNSKLSLLLTKEAGIWKIDDVCNGSACSYSLLKGCKDENLKELKEINTATDS